MSEQNIALAKACAVGNLGEVGRLIDAGADVNYINNGRSVIHTAVNNGRARIVELLVRRGADVNDRNDGWDRATPLIEAIKGRHLEIAEFLINNGADVNARNKAGTSPLYIAANYRHQNPDLTKLLLSKGATIDQKLMDAVKDKYSIDGYSPEIVDILEKWPQTMALATLQSDPMVYNVYNHTDASDMIDLNQYMGKKGKDFGGKRRRTNKRKTNKRRRTNRRRNSRKSSK